MCVYRTYDIHPSSFYPVPDNPQRFLSFIARCSRGSERKQSRTWDRPQTKESRWCSRHMSLKFGENPEKCTKIIKKIHYGSSLSIYLDHHLSSLFRKLPSLVGETPNKQPHVAPKIYNIITIIDYHWFLLIIDDYWWSLITIVEQSELSAKEHAHKTQLVQPLHELFSIKLVWDVPREMSWDGWMVGMCWNAVCLGSNMGWQCNHNAEKCRIILIFVGAMIHRSRILINVGYSNNKAPIIHPFLMAFSTHLWWLGGWFIIAIPTLLTTSLWVNSKHESRVNRIQRDSWSWPLWSRKCQSRTPPDDTILDAARRTNFTQMDPTNTTPIVSGYSSI